MLRELHLAHTPPQSHVQKSPETITVSGEISVVAP
jgi:hypothetical protein